MTDPKPTRLFLVRHGETEWNAARLFQGHLDSRLTPTGLEQAVRLAERLAGEEIEAIYSSDQGRAMRTAEVLAKRLGLEVIPRQELREIDCGDWTGRSYLEVKSAWPAEHETWARRPDLHCMPNGESVAAVQERAMQFVEEVRGRHPGQAVCAVTHNTVVRTVACRLLGWSLEKLWEGPKQANCAVNLIEMRNGTIDLVEVGDATNLDSSQVSAISFHATEGKVI